MKENRVKKSNSLLYHQIVIKSRSIMIGKSGEMFRFQDTLDFEREDRLSNSTSIQFINSAVWNICTFFHCFIFSIITTKFFGLLSFSGKTTKKINIMNMIWYDTCIVQSLIIYLNKYTKQEYVNKI